MGVFIDVSIDEPVCADRDGCRALLGLCPVDIFQDVDGRVVVVEDNVDECTLCGLCWQAVPDAVTVTKLY